jgi:hypothetical protein
MFFLEAFGSEMLLLGRTLVDAALLLVCVFPMLDENELLPAGTFLTEQVVADVRVSRDVRGPPPCWKLLWPDR